jgi:hypothetical protein
VRVQPIRALAFIQSKCFYRNKNVLLFCHLSKVIKITCYSCRILKLFFFFLASVPIDVSALRRPYTKATCCLQHCLVMTGNISKKCCRQHVADCCLGVRPPLGFILGKYRVILNDCTRSRPCPCYYVFAAFM